MTAPLWEGAAKGTTAARALVGEARLVYDPSSRHGILLWRAGESGEGALKSSDSFIDPDQESSRAALASEVAIMAVAVGKNRCPRSTEDDLQPQGCHWSCQRADAQARPLWLMASLFIFFALVGCVAQYAPPTDQEPHATIEFRRRYEKLEGTTLVEQLLVDGEQAFKRQDSPADVPAVRSDDVWIRPGQVTLELLLDFSHTKTVFVSENYPCGTSTSPRTCRRTVQRQRRVSDGRCQRQLSVLVEEGESYLLELDYRDRKTCHARCLRRVDAATQQAEGEPCRTTVDDVGEGR